VRTPAGGKCWHQAELPRSKRRGSSPPLPNCLPLSVPVARTREIIVKVAPTLFAANGVTPFLTELFATLLPADLIAIAFPGRPRIHPYPTGSNVDALRRSRQAWGDEQTGCDQTSDEDVLHVDFPSRLGH
jgi:hypothetical protein